ncbi:hypothetical protein [Rossellomorea sp. YZS02]|uniref:hypothetical protein n=1 Tax=Rossellomorea sp. YZS02 TaxID=3097358 RepID=UPI002A11FC83|nr:hypothetical protein [Rossellomorea sp. YZS02]MDX8342613.1 hypothetical protein [Rossellomorea sp. YZS02]
MMSVRSKIISSILVVIGLIFAYAAMKSSDVESALGYALVAIIGFVDAYLFYRIRE